MRMLDNRKGEGEIIRIATAVIIMAMFAGSITAYLVDVEKNYDLGVDTEQFQTFNKIQQLQGNISLPTVENIEEGAGDFSSVGADNVEALLRSGFKSYKLLFSIPAIISSLAVDSLTLASRSGVAIPEIFSIGVMALGLIVVIGSLIALIFKVRP